MKILVPIEDEKFGQSIADFISEHEWPEGSEIRIIHVLEPLVKPPLSGYQMEYVQSVNEERHRAAKSLLLTFGTQLAAKFPRIAIKEELIDGYPKEVILDLAKNWSADMIVMGSHGRRAIGRFFLGSVAMLVLSAAPCSLMIVKRPQDNKENKGKADKVEVSVH
jgi:nucleotide-binding universal stress UspA family protein